MKADMGITCILNISGIIGCLNLYLPFTFVAPKQMQKFHLHWRSFVGLGLQANHFGEKLTTKNPNTLSV
jgi:hypothetical protein